MIIQRMALGVRYDGTAYHGWQRQDGLKTVQGELERALGAIADHPINLVCAGRTDSGVHATAQVVHFNTEVERTDYSWIFGANSNMAKDISVSWAQKVDMEFHARFSATYRRYRYIIYNHPTRPAIMRHSVTWYHRPLNEQKMQEAANFLLGEHDFSSFRGANCQANSPIRKIENITVTRHHYLVIVDVLANAFLHHMIRNIVGVLLPIGEGQRPVSWMPEILALKNRQEGGATAVPNGLYLVEVGYPSHYNLPRMPVGPFFLH
ncbi:MAG: tRNA pseudouridine(38-40) synthase TruA [Gammaproteobacteria bacterium RIFCSPHIGHO2_12_FULL_41_15]|nr:MAG: tRNA pseudouridine(38-40) synthase TruA [Gammaproteobacteria bacterium RIFCSPHIGHO2_12_FULL_41_15]